MAGKCPWSRVVNQRLCLYVSPKINPVSKSGGILRLKADAVTDRYPEGKTVVVVVDTGSSVSLVRSGLVQPGGEIEPVSIGGVVGTMTARSKTKLSLTQVGDKREAHKLEAMVVDRIGPEGSGIDVLLSAQQAYLLGYITVKPSENKIPRRLQPLVLKRHSRRQQPSGITNMVLLATMLLATVSAAGGKDEGDFTLDNRDTQKSGVSNSVGSTKISIKTEAQDGGISSPVESNKGGTDRVSQAEQIDKEAQDRGSSSSGKMAFGESLCLMTEARVQVVLEKKKFFSPGDKADSRDKVKWGDVGQDYTSEERAEMERLLDEFSDVFLEEALPPPCSAEPVKIEMKQEQSKVPFTRRPWKPKEKELLTRVRQQWEEFGYIRRADRPEGTSPVSVAEKPGREDDARVCIDLRQVNELVKDVRVHYADGPEQVERCSSSTHKYRSGFDMASAYSTMRVAEESQRLLNVTLPDKNGRPQVYEYKRLPFGLKSAGAYLNQYLERCFEELPSDLISDGFYRYADDMVVCSKTFTDHLRHLRALFIVCRKHKIRLAWRKTQIMVPTVTFFGFECGPGGSALTTERVRALDELAEPTGISGARHIVGVLNVCSKYCQNFSGRMEPILKLLRTGVTWEWGAQQRHAFEDVKGQLRKQVKLARFDPEAQLVLHTDASGVAEAAWLEQVHSDGKRETLAFYSKTFTPTMRKMGATVREAHAVIWALHKIRIFSLSSTRPTKVYTDCRSLTFVKNSTRSELSMRFLQKIEDQRFTIHYKPGKDNVVADAFSRLPAKGQQDLEKAGVMIALDDLMAHFTTGNVPTGGRIWVYVAEHRDDAYRQVQLWRRRNGHTSAMVCKSPSEDLTQQKFDLRIIRPEVHEAVRWARLLLAGDQPTAILMPLDLVSAIPVDDAGRVAQPLRRALRNCKKRAYLGSNAVWLLHNIKQTADDICLTMESEEITLQEAEPGPWPEGVVPPHQHYGETQWLVERLGGYLDQMDWVPSQQGMVDAMPERLRTHLQRDITGRWWRHRKRGDPQLLVPPQARRLIMTLVHNETNHTAAATLVTEIGRQYWWPGITEDCKEFVDSCAACVHSTMQILRQHNMFSSPEYGAPRKHVCLDVKVISHNGTKTYLLLMVDKFSSWTMAAPLAGRSTGAVIDALDKVWFKVYGAPETISVDGGGEFVSKELRTWLNKQGTRFKEPMEYYHSPAGSAERQWAWIRGALRQTDNFARWRDNVRMATFNHNTTINNTIGCSPFQAFFGGKARKRSSQQRGTPAEGAEKTDVEAWLEGAEAAVAAAKSRGNLSRRVSQVRKNKRGRAPPKFKVGDPVYFVQEISGKSHAKDTRPRTAKTQWLPGVVTEIRFPVHIMRRTDTDRAMTYRRHPSMMKHRPGEVTVEKQLLRIRKELSEARPPEQRST